MKHPVAALLPELRRTAQARRATLAAELYGLDAVRARLVKAAGEGRDTVTIAGVPGLNLRATDAAEAAETWLRDNGLTHRWDTRGGHEDGPAHDLIIEWRDAAL